MSIIVLLSIGSAITATAITFTVKYIKSGDKNHKNYFIGKLMTIMIIVGAAIAFNCYLASPVYTGFIAVGLEGLMC